MYNYCLTGLQLNNTPCSKPTDLVKNEVESFDSLSNEIQFKKYYSNSVENFEEIDPRISMPINPQAALALKTQETTQETTPETIPIKSETTQELIMSFLNKELITGFPNKYLIIAIIVIIILLFFMLGGKKHEDDN